MSDVESSSAPALSFPVSDSSAALEQEDDSIATLRSPVLRPPISFRRISLPSVPSFTPRSAVSSIASSDDLQHDYERDVGGSRPQMGTRFMSDDGRSVMSYGARAPSKSPRKPHMSRSRQGSRTKETSIDDGRRAARKLKVLKELVDTEKTYVEGLNMIYEHFLIPLMASLEDPRGRPLATRDDLTAIFSNFIDIWNLHRSILTNLTEVLNPKTLPGPTLSSVLQSHFPYLSLYKPFVSNFPSSLSTLAHLKSSSAIFASWLADKEKDTRCHSLTLQSWLLTCVQRVPRYLLLLKDLIAYTDPQDEECDNLRRVFSTLSLTAETLDSALASHSLTLSALALQRSCPNLPFPLITPGRRLLKRGRLLKEGPKGAERREFLLFSDALLYFSRQSDDAWLAPERQRSKSGTDVPVRGRAGGGVEEGMVDSEKWRYGGKLDLQDLTVVGGGEGAVPNVTGTRFELHSPHESFAVYAATPAECVSWLSSIRESKALFLSSLQTLARPLSTLTSSTATRSLRLALQALPAEAERRRVEHYVPAVWVPDRKALACMRCGKGWGVARWRHHCRLCGSVVCAACSTKTFYIANPTSSPTAPRKPARACNTCYEAIFPVLPPPPPLSSSSPPSRPSTPDPRPLSTVTLSPSSLSLASSARPQSEHGDTALPELTPTLLELGVSPFAGALRRTEVQRLEVQARLRVTDTGDAAVEGEGAEGSARAGKAVRRLSDVLSRAERQRVGGR